MKISIWSKLTLLLVGLFLTGQGCSFTIGSVGGKDGGVYRSDDHGRTWVQKNFVRQDKKSNILLDDVTGRVLVADPKNSDHIFLGTLANGIWETNNGGEVWSPTSLRSGAYDCLAIDALNSQVLYTAAGQTVLKSIDGGKSWTTVYTESQAEQTVSCVIANPINNRQIWAVTSGGKVLLSNDFAQHWTLVYSLPVMQPRLLYIPPETPSQLFVFTRGQGIFRADELGKKWTDLTPKLPTQPGVKDIRSVTIHPQGWFLATAFGLLKSTDQGNSWITIPTLNTTGSVALQNVAVNPVNVLDIFISTNQRLHQTTNGGQTWSVQSLPTTRLPVLLTFDSKNPDRMYFATFKQAKK